MTAIAITLLFGTAAIAASWISAQSLMRGVSAARSIFAELDSYPADLRPAYAAERPLNRLPACRRPARRYPRPLAA